MIVATCPTFQSQDAFLSALLRHIDCQGQSIGASGYQALSNPASALSLTLTAVLTIFVALFGLRMILGGTPSVKDGVVAVVKVGVVLLIATSWPAYRTLVYDVVIHGPAQLSTALGSGSGLPGARGDLDQRLQRSDNAIVRLTTLGSGRSDLTSVPASDPNGRAAAMEKAPLSDDLAFGSARVLLLASVVAAFAVVRLGAGILLALAPLFAGLLLFDVAKGLFIGWARALVFTLLASVAVTTIVGVELAILEPWLRNVLQVRAAKVIAPGAPIELLVMCLAFALALAGAMWIIMRISFTAHIPALPHSLQQAWSAMDLGRLRGSGQDGSAEQPTRAQSIAAAIAVALRRETAQRSGPSAGQSSSRRLRPAAHHAEGETGQGSASASSSGARRRRRPRTSIASALRDRKS